MGESAMVARKALLGALCFCLSLALVGCARGASSQAASGSSASSGSSDSSLAVSSEPTSVSSSGQEPQSSPVSDLSSGQELDSSSASPSASSPGESAASASTAAESAEPAPELVNCPVIHETEFGGIYIQSTIEDFNNLGFQFGDSVDIECSNGYTLKDVPYYDGYYVSVGDILLVGYPTYPFLRLAENSGDDLWEIGEFSEGDTATVTLAEAGKYAITQDVFGTPYSDERSEAESDQAFANFRPLTGGKLKSNALYRGASPVSNERSRAAYASKMMADAGIKFDLDLSDNDDEIAQFLAEDADAGLDVSYFEELYYAGNVATLDLNVSYHQQDFAQNLAAGLVELANHEGPAYIHCIEGKDRTGFVCALLEALAGATYEEIENDYMITYDNYFKITRESDPVRYDAIKELRLDDMVTFLGGDDEQSDLSKLDLQAGARNYLSWAGMTDEQIDALVDRICN